jgi:hypothetical protein
LRCISMCVTIIKFYLSADRWKNERKLLNSSFSLPVLQSYIPVFDKCITASVKHLQGNCDKGEFDIKHDITVVVMNGVMSKYFWNKLTLWCQHCKNLFSVFSFSPFMHRYNFWQGHISRCRTNIYGKCGKVCGIFFYFKSWLRD